MATVTGRVLNLLYLVDQGLLDTPVLYLSRAIITNKADYYRLLLGITREGEWIFSSALRAVADTARWTTGRIRTIRTLQQETVEKMRQEAPMCSGAAELVDLNLRASLLPHWQLEMTQGFAQPANRIHAPQEAMRNRYPA